LKLFDIEGDYLTLANDDSLHYNLISLWNFKTNKLISIFAIPQNLIRFPNSTETRHRITLKDPFISYGMENGATIIFERDENYVFKIVSVLRDEEVDNHGFTC
jgi:hypothetical protein